MSEAANTKQNSKPKKKLHPALEANKWRPGQSGNPSGRPKKKPITEMFEQMLATDEDFASVRDAVKKVFFQKSGIAKVMLLKDMAERLEGKVAQPVEVNGELTLTLSERMRKAEERLKSVDDGNRPR